MGDDALGHRQLRCRYAPLVGRGLLEHFAGGRAASTHILMRGANPATAASAEIAPHALPRDTLARRGIFPSDLVPIAFELLGDELAQPGDRSLTHLRAHHTDDNSVVGFDNNPGSDLWCGGLRGRPLW